MGAVKKRGRGAEEHSSTTAQEESQVATTSTVKLRGARAFRARLVLATLAKQRVVISAIRESSEEPGVNTEEACFVRLIDKLTSGSTIEIDETGTTLRYSPGFLVGGEIEHDCSKTKMGLGWFLEAVLPLAPFCGSGLKLTLLGVTTGGPSWRSVDALKIASVETVMRDYFGIDVDMSIERRHALSTTRQHHEAAGRIFMRCTPSRRLTPIECLDQGLVQKVRGVAYCTRVSPALANRCVSAARGTLNQLVADVHITTDATSRRNCADMPGFGIVLVAETTTGCKILAELDAAWALPKGDYSPETLGHKTALLLCHQLSKAAVCDTQTQSLLLTLMALTPDHVSVAKLPSPLSEAAIDRLRLLHIFLGVKFSLLQLKKHHHAIKVLCRGANFTNLAKPVT